MSDEREPTVSAVAETIEGVPRIRMTVDRHAPTDWSVTTFVPPEPTEDQLRAVGEAIYKLDAPRYGNDIRPFEEVGSWDQRKFVEMARVAVAAWQKLQG